VTKQTLRNTAFGGAHGDPAPGNRMTSTRRQVLEALRAADRPLGAYDVLAQLNASGRRAQAPAAYSALDFLVARGFAHKLSTRRAYVACDHPGTAHEAAFMICRRCGRAIETCLAARRGPLDDEASAAGFAIEHTVLEVEGVCADCRPSSRA
jgi:Fur family zinc uptake transcriptional regulator